MAVALTEARIQPAVAELLDAATLRAIGTLGSSTGALLIVQTNGSGAAADAAIAAEVLARTATEVRTTTDPARAAELLAARRQALPAIERLGRPLIEDIAVPRSRLAEAIRGIQTIAALHEVTICTLAHAGDGNLHPIVADPDAAAATIPVAVSRAADDIFALALDLGGTLTGQHGIGTLKRAWPARELGPVSHDLQRQIKTLFDPNGILNPGKAL